MVVRFLRGVPVDGDLPAHAGGEELEFTSVNVEIRRNSDGVVRRYVDEHWLSDFIWSEGNYACDCNRHLFFERAGGNEPYSDPDYPNPDDCTDGGYSVRITDNAGSVLYQDGGCPK